jgi:hypothetical protein
LLVAAGLLLISAAPASAYSVTGYDFLTNGPIDAVPGSIPTCGSANVACATFTYSGALNFSNTQPENATPAGDLNSDFFVPADISGYSGSGSVTYNYNGTPTQIANFDNLADFLPSSGSIAGEGYGSLYVVDLGTLAAGTILTINHDDGIYLSENGVQIGNTVYGPTAAITENATVATTGDVMLYYTRQNGTPSILQVTVPEPASIAVFGAALICMAGMAGWMRRSRASV